MISLTSRDNPQIKRLRRLAQDNKEYRAQGRYWLEGEHLCMAAMDKGQRAQVLVLSESWLAHHPAPPAAAADEVWCVPDALFDSLSGMDSPGRIGMLMPWTPASRPLPGQAAVVLDRLQDAGNVGAILRCAAAFGFKQVLALQGTAALWSPKVLRAGMGAHMSLHLAESLVETDLQSLSLPMLVTSSHEGPFLHELQSHARLPWPCAWVMGHEGQGVSASLMQQAAQRVRIVQPGGEESLNVATAAAICLHASAVLALHQSA